MKDETAAVDGKRKRTGVTQQKQSQKFVRLWLVLSAMSPLFILWAIRGSTLFPAHWFLSGCLALFALTNVGLVLQIALAIRADDKQPLVVDEAKDHREDVLVYLFALVFPFYTAELDSWRNFFATVVAFSIVVFLFWHLGLHYINIWVAVLGYRVFAVSTADSERSHSEMRDFVVITKQPWLSKGSTIIGYRITNGVYLEEGS